MRDNPPLVSVIIPCHRAQGTLERGLVSIAVAAQHAKIDGQIEVILGVDDGAHHDYAPLVQRWPFVRLVASDCLATGPSRARNRAMAVARGEFLAFMDADDSWNAGYLSALLPLAQAKGASFGATDVLDHDASLLGTLGGSKPDQLQLSEVGTLGGSLHPLVRRDLLPLNVLDRSQDVWSACMALVALGGVAPMSGTARYQLQLAPGTMTTIDDFSAQIAAAYQRLEQRALAATQLPQELRQTLVQVWRDKARLNKAFEQAQQLRASQALTPWPSFYHWRFAQPDFQGRAEGGT